MLYQAISKKKIIQDWQMVSKKAKWLIIGTIPLASEISADSFLWCVEKAFNSGIKSIFNKIFNPHAKHVLIKLILGNPAKLNVVPPIPKKA